MFIVLINDRLIDVDKYTNFSCLQMECRYFNFLMVNQSGVSDIPFAKHEKLLNVLISINRSFF